MAGRKCPTGKPRFGSELTAKMVLVRLQAKLVEPPTRVYQCNLCRGWHTTSQPQRTQVQ